MIIPVRKLLKNIEIHTEPNTSLGTPQVETFFELTLMTAPDIVSRHGLK